MSRQEEVKKLIEKYISLAYWYDGHENIVERLTKGLITRLSKKGVVIKTGIIVPSGDYVLGKGIVSYPTVEPLIKELEDE